MILKDITVTEASKNDAYGIISKQTYLHLDIKKIGNKKGLLTINCVLFNFKLLTTNTQYFIKGLSSKIKFRHRFLDMLKKNEKTVITHDNNNKCNGYVSIYS